MPTWDSAAADDLWTEACGKGRWLGNASTLEQQIRLRLRRKALAAPYGSRASALVDYARERVVQGACRLRRFARSGRRGRSTSSTPTR